MIDNIKIYFPKTIFNGKDNCWKFERKINKYTNEYRYTKYTFSNSHSLVLHFNTNKKHITIMGSLRKWYLGKTSLVDLTSEQFMKVSSLLANSLNMSLDEFNRGKITQCEIGLNIRTQTPPLEILPKIAAYKMFYRDDTYESSGTLYFGSDNSNRKITIYDKCKEITDNYRGDRFNAVNKVHIALAKRNYHFLRLEVKLKNKKSFKDLGCNIEYFGDILPNWEKLYLLWLTEMGKLIVYHRIIESNDMLLDEYKVACMLNLDTYYNVMKKIKLYSRSKTSKGLKSMVLKERDFVRSVIYKFADKSKYNNVALKNDIEKSLYLILKKESLNLPLLYKTLYNAQNT